MDRGRDRASSESCRTGTTRPSTTKAVRLQGFLDAPKRTRTSTRLSRTRPSTWSLARHIHPPRIRTSITSGGLDDMDALDGVDVATNVAARARRRCTSAQRWTDRTCRSPMYVVVASRDERSLPRAGVSSAPATGDRISRKRRLPSSSGRNVCCSSKAVAPDLTADTPARVLKAAGCPFDAPSPSEDVMARIVCQSLSGTTASPGGADVQNQGAPPKERRGPRAW